MTAPSSRRLCGKVSTSHCQPSAVGRTVRDMATKRPPGMPAASALWRAADGQPWVVTVTEWAIIAGRYEPVGVEIRCVRRAGRPGDAWAVGVLPPDKDDGHSKPRRKPRPVTGDLVRSLPLGRLLREVRAAMLSEIGSWGRSSATASWLSDAHPDDELATVAAIYTDAFSRGESPRQAVVREMHLSERTASRRIEQARKAGHLRKTTRGRAAADAVEMLGSISQDEATRAQEAEVAAVLDAAWADDQEQESESQ
jgi:hypothetical protein